MQAVIETPRYPADAERLFSAHEREAIVDLVAGDRGTGQARRCTGALYVRWRRRAGFFARGLRQERKGRSDSCGACDNGQGGGDDARKLSEKDMSKRAFNKIMQGI